MSISYSSTSTCKALPQLQVQKITHHGELYRSCSLDHKRGGVYRIQSLGYLKLLAKLKDAMVWLERHCDVHPDELVQYHIWFGNEIEERVRFMHTNLNTVLRQVEEHWTTISTRGLHSVAVIIETPLRIKQIQEYEHVHDDDDDTPDKHADIEIDEPVLDPMLEPVMEQSEVCHQTFDPFEDELESPLAFSGSSNYLQLHGKCPAPPAPPPSPAVKKTLQSLKSNRYPPKFPGLTSFPGYLEVGQRIKQRRRKSATPSRMKNHGNTPRKRFDF